jgi:hypothetical protein
LHTFRIFPRHSTNDIDFSFADNRGCDLQIPSYLKVMRAVSTSALNESLFATKRCADKAKYPEKKECTSVANSLHKYSNSTSSQRGRSLPEILSSRTENGFRLTELFLEKRTNVKVNFL